MKSCGLALAGLGLVFMGLSVMSGTMKGYAGNESVQSMLQTIKNPFYCWAWACCLPRWYSPRAR
ncbi:MAG: hypothetical protein ACLR06_00185 [Christensenellaceae bacterium]